MIRQLPSLHHQRGILLVWLPYLVYFVTLSQTIHQKRQVLGLQIDLQLQVALELHLRIAKLQWLLRQHRPLLKLEELAYFHRMAIQ